MIGTAPRVNPPSGTNLLPARLTRMLRNFQHHHPWLLTLLCAMLLVTQVRGAHLHLCFDGGEPPASLHLLDDGVHHYVPGMGEEHQDADIAVAGEVLVKFAKLSLDLPAPVVWSLLQAPRQPAPGYRKPLSPSALIFLRPPLRAPPSHSLV